jgi:hypothetical protein
MTDRIIGCPHEEGSITPTDRIARAVPVLGASRPLDHRHRNATYFAKSDHRHHLVGRTPSSAAGPLAGSSMIAGA